MVDMVAVGCDASATVRRGTLSTSVYSCTTVQYCAYYTVPAFDLPYFWPRRIRYHIGASPSFSHGFLLLLLPSSAASLLRDSLISFASMRDCIKLDALDDERTRWLDGLDNDEICQLASSFRGGDQCAVFQPRKHGAFNVCYFVEFKSPLERWVVRIPIPVTIPKTILDEKTEIELATMRFVDCSIPSPASTGSSLADLKPTDILRADMYQPKLPSLFPKCMRMHIRTQVPSVCPS